MNTQALESEESQASYHTACQSLGFPRHKIGFKTVLGLSRGLQTAALVGQRAQLLEVVSVNLLRNAANSCERSRCLLDWEYSAGRVFC